MALQYLLKQCKRTFKDGRRDSANGKWYARAFLNGVRDTENLAKRISYATTVTESDVLAVLKSLSREFNDAFQNSQSVRLDGIGLFRPGIKSRGALEAEGFSVSKHITGVHVNFLPEYNLNTATRTKVTPMLDGIKFKEAPKNAVGVVTE